MSQDFLRRLPDRQGFAATRRTSLMDMIHLDPVILLLLFVTCSYGLLVLYSALFLVS